MVQLAITARDNKNLFSNYYLDNQIKNNNEWRKEEHKAAFSEIKKLYDIEKDFIPTLNEKQLEQRFFAPIFKILNHTFEVNEGTEQGEFPDYAFFPDRASLDDAHKKMGNSFYDNAFAIGEVKRWGIELDRFGKDEKDRKRNPSLQIWIYLHDVSPKWGILSNGAKWRLYCKDRRRDDYYEIDLPSLLATNDIENFKYFYYFFRREAFLSSTDGKIFLNEVLKGSADYAKDIGDDLKDNVYKAMKKVAEGFFSWSQNGLDIQNEAVREKVQKSTMLLLYRFLFLLYAEGKGLLNLGAGRYRDSYSFYKLKNEVKDKQDGPIEQRYMSAGTSLWFRLRDLFRLINQGNESLGIPKNEIDVPAYNGGLFDPDKNKELDKEWTISDTFIAAAIDLLSRSRADGGKLDFVDYSTLEIRHLGSIYEGLLEYKLRVAEDEMIVNGGEWVKLEEFNKDRKQKKVFSDFNEFDRVKKGQIYLATDKGERKATGSYYTPDYIVNYIVKNTIGPVVDEKWKEAEANKKSLVDATLSVKVLDPAMGSGHFLVGSIEFLSEKLLLAVKKDIDNSRFSDESHLTSDWARREVVAHCIYGVDLNLMAVELAKVGLWLTTISKEKPLSFLDHRLKQGNSLIGARLSDLKTYPGAKKKDKDQTMLPSFISPLFITHLIGKIAELDKIKDERLEDIKRKEKVFAEFRQLPEYRKAKALANVYTGVYFGNEVKPTENKDSANVYYDLFWAIMGDENEWRKKTNRDWFVGAEKIAQEKSFFHWELEFPEIFFEGGAPKENPGWDAVVGNPPYVNAIGLNKTLSEYEKPFWKQVFKSASGAYDLYILFIELAIKLTRKQRLLSLITPNKFLSAPYAVAFREYFCQTAKLLRVLNLSRVHVFEDPSVYPIITVVENASPTGNYEISIEIPTDTHSPSDTTILIQNSENLTKLPENIWGFLISENLPLILKAEQISVQLQRCSTVRASSTAAESDTYEDALTDIEGVNRKKFINTGLIDRYDTLWGVDSLTHKGVIFTTPYLDMSNPAVTDERKSQYGKPKIVFAKMAKRVEAFLDEKGDFASANTNFSYDSEYDLRYLLSVLNSNLMAVLYCGYFGSLIMSGGYFQFQAPQLRVLPIRRISFTTPPARRAALVEEAKALYSAEAPDRKDFDRINRMDRINPTTNPVNPVHPVQMDANSYSAAPDSQKILDFVGARLSAKTEESDVVHDLLAHLAERMIEMNKKKNEEIKGFLRWLEGEIGAPVEELANKTALKEYYAHDFEAFAGALVKNKKKLKEGYDPTRREPKEKLQGEFNASVEKLAPRLKRIEATDGLIDAIVYRLYGLTGEEIKIVEGSISGENNAEGSKNEKID
ncbi:MAG: Eco57I restriction-modification methylase domain-containing protein [Candidatus Methanoperedens sp.]|nr:Eco57I restriction-modification methylase domain-containing protein [Candidatus Methanoperedens sp.]